MYVQDQIDFKQHSRFRSGYVNNLLFYISVFFYFLLFSQERKQTETSKPIRSYECGNISSGWIQLLLFWMAILYIIQDPSIKDPALLILEYAHFKSIQVNNLFYTTHRLQSFTASFNRLRTASKILIQWLQDNDVGQLTEFI